MFNGDEFILIKNERVDNVNNNHNIANVKHKKLTLKKGALSSLFSHYITFN